MVTSAALLFGVVAAFVKATGLPTLLMLETRSVLEWVLGVGVACVYYCNAQRHKIPPLPQAEAVLVQQRSASRAELAVPADSDSLMMLLVGPTRLWGWLVLRAFLYWAFLGLWWLALTAMPIGDATTIVYCGPIFTALFASIFLGEKIDWTFYPIVVLDGIGLVLITRPAFLFPDASGDSASPMSSPTYLIGAASALFAAVVAGLLPVCTRLSKDCSWTAVNHVSSALSALVFTPLAIAIWSYVDSSATEQLSSGWEQMITPVDDEPLVAGLGKLSCVLGATFTGFAGLALQTLGYQREEAAKASIMTILEIPFAYLLQHALFHDELNALAMLGVCCVVGGTMLNLLRQLKLKAKTRPADEDPAMYVELPAPHEKAPVEKHFSSVPHLIAIGFTSGLANGFNGTLLEGAIPRMQACGVITNAWQAGYLGGALSLGGLLGSLACTDLALRLSRRWMVILGEAFIIVGVGLFALAPTFECVLLGRTLCGVGVGICGLAKPLIVSELAPTHMRGMLISLFAVGQSVGLNIFYVTDFILPQADVEWAWRLLAALGSTPAIIVISIATFTPRAEYWDPQPSAGGSNPTAGGAKSSDSPVALLGRMLKEPWPIRRNFLLILALMLGYNLSGTLIISNYASQIFESIHAADRALPIAIGVVQFLGLVSAAAGTDHFGRRPLLLFSCVLTAASLFAIGALLAADQTLTAALGDAMTPILLSLMIAVEFAVGAGLNPIRIILSAELLPNRYRALGMSLGNVVGWSLALISLSFFPILSNLAGGPAPQFAFFGAIVTALTILLAFELPETNGIDLK